jgi:hypothetical protein
MPDKELGKDDFKFIVSVNSARLEASRRKPPQFEAVMPLYNPSKYLSDKHLAEYQFRTE